MTVTVKGRPAEFVSFVRLDPDQPVVRVRFRDRADQARWRCDVDGPSRDAQCDHARAVLSAQPQEIQ